MGPGTPQAQYVLLVDLAVGFNNLWHRLAKLRFAVGKLAEGAAYAKNEVVLIDATLTKVAFWGSLGLPDDTCSRALRRHGGCTDAWATGRVNIAWVHPSLAAGRFNIACLDTLPRLLIGNFSRCETIRSSVAFKYEATSLL